MRYALALLCSAFILILPPLSHAATSPGAPAGPLRPPMTPSKCPSGASTEVQGVKSMLLKRDTDQNAARRFLQTAIYCPNACYDIVATMTLTFTGLQVDVSARHVCSSNTKAPNDPSQQPKRGCVKGEQEPQITIATRDVYSNAIGFRIADQTIKKSRCDGNVIDNSVNKFFGGLSQVTTNKDAAQNQMQAALDYLRTGSDPRPAAVSPLSNQEALAKALTTAGLDPQKAKEAVQKDPEAAARLLSDIASGNEKSVEEGKRMLGLESAVFDQKKADEALKARAAELRPEDVDGSRASVEPGTGDGGGGRREGGVGGDITGFEREGGANGSGMQTQCGIEGFAGNLMYAESRCGRNTYSATTNVVGPYQFLCPTWRTYANETGYGSYSDCGYANDTAIATKVVNARYDMYAQQYGEQCTQSGLSLTSCMHAIHVFGENGFRNMLNAYRNDPNASSLTLCGGALSGAACSNNMSIFRNGGTVGGVFAELDRRLGGNAAAIPSVASTPASPFAFAGNQHYPYENRVYGGSPFANSMPYNPPPPQAPPSAPVRPPAQNQPPVQPVTPPPRTSQPPVQAPPLTLPVIPVEPPGGSTPPPPPAPNVKPVANIFVQPASVPRGRKIVVSWAAFGMRTDVPCEVLLEGAAGYTVIARGYQGSRSITATSTGQVQFTLQCTAQDDGVVRESSVVNVI